MNNSSGGMVKGFAFDLPGVLSRLSRRAERTRSEDRPDPSGLAVEALRAST